MRFITTVLGTAITVFLLYLLVGGIVDGYFGGDIVPDKAVPDSWAAPDSWREWRDILFVLLGLFWVFAGILLVALLIALLFLVGAVRKVLRENAAPAIDSLKASLDNIRGTTEFAGESIASPIIRAYAVVKGVRSGLGAITALPALVGRRRKKKGRR